MFKSEAARDPVARKMETVTIDGIVIVIQEEEDRVVDLKPIESFSIKRP